MQVRKSRLVSRQPLRGAALICNDNEGELRDYDNRSPKERRLLTLNKVAGFLHLVSFCAACVVTGVFLTQSYQTQLTTDFRRYNESVPVGAPETAGNFTSTLDNRGYYRLVWVDLPFPLITALFHLMIGFGPGLLSSVQDQYLRDVMSNKGNYLRWLEYSITASLMTWVILQLSGVTNVFLLIMAGPVANIALQCQGYLQEKFRTRSYVPTIVGWLIFSAQWAVILSYFFVAITSERPPDAPNVPWFVYSIVIGLFVQFIFFGLVQLGHLMQ